MNDFISITDHPDLKPVAFYPYTSRVRDRIFQMEYNTSDKRIIYLRKGLIELFRESGIKCENDNKIVFELELHGKSIFYGFYDFMFSIGFNVWSEHKGNRKEN